MTQMADVIVVGRAVERETRWVGRDLVTFVTVAVAEALKGDPGATVTVSVPGGIDASRKFKVAVTYPGAPSIAPNEEVVLFLVDGQDVAGAFSVAGFSQGKYAVVEDAGGVKHVTRDLSMVTIATPRGVTRGTQTRKRLSELRDDVRRILGGGAR
jgi:hypothetical protein